MNFIDTAILGVVEGITEFLPISSTGHLILTSHLLRLSGEEIDTFNVFIQLGAILAVVVLYHHRFRMLFESAEGFAGLKGWKLLALTSLPAMILGFLTHKYIKTLLFGPMPVIMALFVGGIAIILVEKINMRHNTTSLDTLKPRQAFIIGCFQCLALWPGTSRAAATIVGGMVSGLDYRSVAAQYSFIAAVPLMVMATGYDLLKSYHAIQHNHWPLFAWGFVVTFLAAIPAVKFLISLMQRSTLVPFGIYRIVLSILFFLLMTKF